MKRTFDKNPDVHRFLKEDRFHPQLGEDVRRVKLAHNKHRDRGGGVVIGEVTEDGTAGVSGIRKMRDLAALLGVLWVGRAGKGLSKRAQRVLRHPDVRTVAERARAEKRLTKARKNLARDVPGIVDGWHPKATRVPYSGGTFVTGNPKIVWHTTEGFGLPSYSGSAPHFTLDPKTGKLYQHIPITQAAKALMHPAGTGETNNARALQVELIEFAKNAASWPASYYDNIAGLARWLEKHGGVQRKCSVTFKVGARRMGEQEFVDYNGHCGHQHVPHNDHWDPGAFRIDEVLR